MWIADKRVEGSNACVYLARELVHIVRHKGPHEDNSDRSRRKVRRIVCVLLSCTYM